MSNIEDIKEYNIELNSEQSVEKLQSIFNKFEIRGEQLYILKIAIDNVLTERERDKKKIQYLEEVDKANKIVIVEQCDYMQNKSISKQKVKEVLDDIYNYSERLNGPDEDIEYIERKREELLKGEENDR